MRNPVALLSALALIVVGSLTVARAADMAVKAPPKPVPLPVYNWTGFYLGVHGGGDWFHKDWFTPVTPINLTGGCTPCNVSDGGHSGDSWLAGVQGGLNYQVNRAVLGIEAQASWTNLRASNADPNASILIHRSKTDDLGTIAGRLGAAWDRSLLFVKGGGAWAHDTFSNDGLGSGCSPCQTVTETRWGWMIGAGWEYAFLGNWSAKIEYDHLDFGTRRETLEPTPACPFCFPFQNDVKQRIDLVKAGLNYRFNWVAPVSARD